MSENTVLEILSVAPELSAAKDVSSSDDFSELSSLPPQMLTR